MTIVASMNGAPSGEGFVVAGGTAGTLRLRTTDGVSRDLVLRPSGPRAQDIVLSETVFVASTDDRIVSVNTGSPGSLREDTIEILVDGLIVATFTFTSISRVNLQFDGRFQCRLSSDPDGFDHPWGAQSSFGLYAVSGPDEALPFEPPLDRVVRFHDPVASRPFCPTIGVTVKAVRGTLADGSIAVFRLGDTAIGQAVMLGPDCKFDARDGSFAQPGFEPISDFKIVIGDVLSGETVPALPRPDPTLPPPCTAPYADGFFRMDQMSELKPPDFAYPEPTWTLRSTNIMKQKIASLNAQVPANQKDRVIRDRRIKEHQSNSGGLEFAMRMLERYAGVVDRNIVMTPGQSTAVRALQNLPALQFYAEFFDFDSDCQSGTVWGTIGSA